jgi:hypothetical protein
MPDMEIPATEAAPVTPPAAPANSSHMETLALVAKKEKAIFQKQREMTQKAAAWEKEKAEYSSKVKAYEEREGRWKSDPLKYFEESGNTYQSVTEKVLNGGELTPKDVQSKLQKELDDLKAQLAGEKSEAQKRNEEQAKQSEAKTIADYKGTLQGFVSENKGTLKLTGLFDPQADLLYDTIETHYDQTCEKDEDGNILKPGKILNNKEATELVEKYLVKQVHLACKALGIPLPAEGEPTEAQATDKSAMPSGTRTLNNSMTSGTSLVSAKTDADRTKRALAAMDAIERAKKK